MPLRYLTAGESHGPGLTAILEGLPSQVPLKQADIDIELKRRQQGFGRGQRMKIESDSATITGGVRHGKTLGSPLSFWIPNKDFENWSQEMSAESLTHFESQKTVLCPRPGHADLSGTLKYGHNDIRNILERASARETAARVAVGATCKSFIRELGIDVTGHVVQIGTVVLNKTENNFKLIQKKQEKDPCRCIDSAVSKKMQALIAKAKENGDTLGGVFEIIFTGVPVGLGSHVQWDRKLDAKMAQTLISIQAVKGVEFGFGFKLGALLGSEAHDAIYYNKTKRCFERHTNRAGGFEGGMTNSENLVIRSVMKPIATLLKHPLDSVNILTKKACPATVERSDTCAVPAASVIAENLLCFDLANALLEKFGGDSLDETKRNLTAYKKALSSKLEERKI